MAVFSKTSQGASWVYLFSAAHGVKVGMTRTTPEQRRLAMQMAVGVEITIEQTWECGDLNPFMVEAHAHRLLAEHRLYGEWFDCTVDVARAAIQAAFGSDAPARIAQALPPAKSPNVRGRPSLSRPGVGLREVREARGLTLTDLKRATGIGPAVWSQIERGLMVPMPQHIAALSAALDVPPDSWRIRFVLETEAQ